MVLIELETKLTALECSKIITEENIKDVREANTLLKVLEGRAGELSYIRRKAAGAILHQLTKVLMNAEKKDWVIQNLKERVANGTEKMISYTNGKLILEFSEFDMIGADMLKRRSAAEKNLMKRFHATSLRYIKEGGKTNVNESKDA